MLSHDRTSGAADPARQSRGGGSSSAGTASPATPTLAGAALREAVEESGLADADGSTPCPVQLDEHAVPFCGPDGDVHHLDVRFVAVATGDAEHAVSEESLDVAVVADRRPARTSELVELVRSRWPWLSPRRTGGGSTRAAADQPSR